jgi:phenylpropionate dioxygenase-like ring-hydroxylating dioxygenase large terminal subunit
VPANGRAAPQEARFSVNRYPIREEHGFIFIFWGEEARARESPRFFDDLDASFTYSTHRDPWDAHYSRAIENQLDVAHLPFVHRTTIGRGNATLADGPVVRWLDDNLFRVCMFNRKDDGSRPRKPDEITVKPEPEFHLEFLYPNLWQNHISRRVRVVVAFAPVDEAHTILYLRFYQNLVRASWLRKLVCRLAMPYNRLIVHQDRRVVMTQEPKRSELKSGEQLLQADGPIVQYRRRRGELIVQGEKKSRARKSDRPI